VEALREKTKGKGPDRVEIWSGLAWGHCSSCCYFKEIVERTVVGLRVEEILTDFGAVHQNPVVFPVADGLSIPIVLFKIWSYSQLPRASVPIVAMMVPAAFPVQAPFTL
jgi:hypothetical protein